MQASTTSPDVRHRAETTLPGPAWYVAGVASVLAVLFVETGLSLAFAAGYLDFIRFIPFHLGICAAAIVLGAFRSREERRVTLVLLGLWSALAGPFGSLLATALVMPRGNAGSRTREAAAPGSESKLDQVELLHIGLLDGRLPLRSANGVRPLFDVMLNGTQAEKFDALALIAKRYRRELAPALKRALEDNEPSVRVLAATVTAQRHDAFTRQIGDLQSMSRLAPDCAAHWRELGQAHLAYASSGLLERSRAEAEAAAASSCLARAIQLDGGDQTATTNEDAGRSTAYAI